MGTYLGLALRGPLAAIFPHHEGLTALRRDLHANPEIGFEEHRTSALGGRADARPWHRGAYAGSARPVSSASFTAQKNASGRSIALRADMDALPMHGGKRIRASLDQAGVDARLRARRAYDDADRRGAVPGAHAQVRRHRVSDLSAGRRRVRGREGDDRRRPVRAISLPKRFTRCTTGRLCRRARSG